MVSYFKMSRSITVIAPLNGHSQSQNCGDAYKTNICSICSCTWRYVFRVLQKSSHRYVFVMRSGLCDRMNEVSGSD